MLLKPFGEEEKADLMMGGDTVGGSEALYTSRSAVFTRMALFGSWSDTPLSWSAPIAFSNIVRLRRSF